MSEDSKHDLAVFRERAEKMLTLDHFGMLGVPRTAAPAEVQKAFIDAVKTWHPDRLPPQLAELKPLVMQVFARLEKARSTLADTGLRHKYVGDLAKPRRTLDPADIATAEAEFEFKKAEAFLKRNDMATAEGHLRRAAELAPKNAEYRATLAWISVKPTSTRSELEVVLRELDQVVAKDGSKRALLYRAQVRKRLDMAKEAYGDFLRVTELDPSNIDAQREVRLYRMRQEKGASSDPPNSGTRSNDDGVGGFFKKLFKR